MIQIGCFFRALLYDFCDCAVDESVFFCRNFNAYPCLLVCRERAIASACAGTSWVITIQLQ